MLFSHCHKISPTGSRIVYSLELGKKKTQRTKVNENVVARIQYEVIGRYNVIIVLFRISRAFAVF